MLRKSRHWLTGTSGTWASCPIRPTLRQTLDQQQLRRSLPVLTNLPLVFQSRDMPGAPMSSEDSLCSRDSVVRRGREGRGLSSVTTRYGNGNLTDSIFAKLRRLVHSQGLNWKLHAVCD